MFTVVLLLIVEIHPERTRGGLVWRVSSALFSQDHSGSEMLLTTVTVFAVFVHRFLNIF